MTPTPEDQAATIAEMRERLREAEKKALQIALNCDEQKVGRLAAERALVESEAATATLSAQNAALRKALKYARRFLDESVLDIAFIDEALALPAPETASDG